MTTNQNAAAQATASPVLGDTLVSPKVLPDHRVTFRIYAPKASEVSIDGDWIDDPVRTNRLTRFPERTEVCAGGHFRIRLSGA